MEALHRQVLPFLLRRMKEDVLQDLPPKIIQDYYCNLSPLQVLQAPNNNLMNILPVALCSLFGLPLVVIIVIWDVLLSSSVY